LISLEENLRGFFGNHRERERERERELKVLTKTGWFSTKEIENEDNEKNEKP
jgi:hypothetical protein